MIDSRKKVLTWVSAFCALALLAVPFYGQEETDDEIRPRKSAGEVKPSFLGEKIKKTEGDVDARELLSKLAEKLGGNAAYKNIKDLRYRFKHKYYMNNKLLYIQDASVYHRMGDRIKTRYDFDYINPKDFEEKLDYREIVGEDGPFKFLRGRILRGPVPVKEAGERLIRYTASLLVPFCLDPEEANPRYMGQVTWKDLVDGKEKEIACHKVLVEYNRRQGNIEGNVLALYLDTKTTDLVRMVIELYSPLNDVEKIRIIDYVKRSPVEGVLLPSEMRITDIWEKKLYAQRTVYFSDIKANTGLEGIGFEIIDQKTEEEEEAAKDGK
jgi:hypothetical protein